MSADDDNTSSVPIRSAVESLLMSRGLEDAARLSELTASWETAAGVDLARRVRPVGLRGDELIVEVEEPAWATHVRLSSGALLAVLAEHLGPGAPHRLSVRVARPRTRPGEDGGV